MYIVGIGDVTHDTSVCLMKDSKIIAAIEEERLTRIKHNLVLDPKKYTLKDQGEHFHDQLKYLTVAAREKKHLSGINYCLSAAGIEFEQIDTLVISSLFADLPFRHKACFINHHLAHAASAFYPSPFKNAAVLVIDGYGSYTEGTSECVLYAHGRDNRLDTLDVITGCCDFLEQEKKQNLKDTHIIFKNSLGVFYQNITLLIGMGHFGEGKTMALAAYGQDNKEFDVIRDFIELQPDGKISIDNRSIFNYCLQLIERAKLSLTKDQLFKLYADLAYKHQQLLEEMIIHGCKHLYEMTREKNICLAGGVFLNGVANYKILQSTPFEKIFIQPAAGDNGISIGCAMYGNYVLAGKSRKDQIGRIFSAYLGKTYNTDEIDRVIKKYAPRLKEEVIESDIYTYAAKLISEGRIIAWFQGGSEIGPRALGNRSILADPRRRDMKETLNLKVKKRENFRPFAPAVLAEHTNEYFDLNTDSPYMLLVSSVRSDEHDIIPAVTHVDGSARVQTVSKDINAGFYKLIQCFNQLTGVPLLLNTSFNGHGEPIVETPEDAIKCFLNINVDMLFINNRVFCKIPLNITIAPRDMRLATNHRLSGPKLTANKGLPTK